jgi:hypothetical protein
VHHDHRAAPVLPARVGALVGGVLLALFALLVPAGATAPASAVAVPASAVLTWEQHAPDGAGAHAVLAGQGVRGVPPEVPSPHRPVLVGPVAGTALPRLRPGRAEPAAATAPRTGRGPRGPVGSRAPPLAPRTEVVKGAA